MALLDCKAKFPGGVYADLADIQLRSLRKRPDAAGPEPAVSIEAVEASLWLTREDRRRIQRALVAAGFRPGRPDGLFGRRTRAAVREWQAARRMKPTGILDADAVKVLLASAAELKPEPDPRGPVVGERFRDCADCPEMVVVPAGTFMMGSPSGEKERFDDEGPRHRVRIARSFAAGVYEVPFAQWDACRRGGGCTQITERVPVRRVLVRAAPTDSRFRGNPLILGPNPLQSPFTNHGCSPARPHSLPLVGIPSSVYIPAPLGTMVLVSI